MIIQKLYSKITSPKKAKSAKKPDVGYLIKTSVCILAFLSCVLYFSAICRHLADDYLMILVPTVKITVPWSIHLCVSAMLLAVMAGVIEVLVRPVWMVIVTFVLAASVFVLIIGPDQATGIAGLVFFIIMSLHFTGVNRLLKNQIGFSLYPFANKKMIVFILLSALVGMAFALGYSKDALKNSYILPPQIKAPLEELIFAQAKMAVDSQEAAPEQKQAALEAVRPKVKTMVDDMEKKLEPYTSVITWLMGILFFNVALVVFLIVGLLSMIVLRLLFFLLRITRFAQIATEMREVRRFTLYSVPQAPLAKNKK